MSIDIFENYSFDITYVSYTGQRVQSSKSMKSWEEPVSCSSKRIWEGPVSSTSKRTIPLWLRCCVFVITTLFLQAYPTRNQANIPETGPLFTKRTDVLLQDLAKSRRLDVIMIVSLWNLTDISAALLSRYLPYITAIGKVKARSSRLRGFTRSCGKTSVRLVNKFAECRSRLSDNLRWYMIIERAGLPRVLYENIVALSFFITAPSSVLQGDNIYNSR